ncbi:hypothetical protein [Fodinibius sp.]|uniref:hypothetical protein n=1 Tax=Fodinibius sp. TaxID=1872440 RepID=UPI00356AA4E0
MGCQMQWSLIIVGWIWMFFTATGTVVGQQTLPDSRQQISAAVSAAPESMQAGAMVLGYNADTTLSTLREGTNNLICIADNPRDSEFHVACYHKDLDPFMERGRELKAKGMSRKEVDLIRRSEIKSGQLPMPEKPMALYSLSGPADAFNYENSTAKEVSPTYVVYIPFATEASTGLAKKPVSEGAPWIMEPGTPWAHIMVITGETIDKQVKTDGK